MASFNAALGNMDIWTEVLQYLRIFPGLDSEGEVADKRRALLRVALLSRPLTDVALDTLWATMTSLEPVVHVINSKAISPDDEILLYEEDDYYYWMLRRPLNIGERDRAFEYLSRIHHFQASVGYAREMELWSTLGISLGLSTPSPLLPCLRSLSLDFTQYAMHIGSWITAIYHLLSPTLTAITYNGPRYEHADGVDTLQTMLRSQSPPLAHVTYRGYPSAFLLQNCVIFEGLETVKLTCEFGRLGIEYDPSGATIAEVFEKLRYLKDLEIDVTVFPLRDSTMGLSQPEITSPPFLQRLSITGDAADINQFLLDEIKSSSLLSLSITITDSEPGDLTWEAICDRIALNFPQLHSLSFGGVGAEDVPQMVLQDLSAFRSRSQMQSIQLSGIPHCFTEANISGLLDSWPNLHTLSISNDYTIHFSASLLIRLSQANHLRHVKLPLDLASLHTLLPDDPVLASCNVVQELTLTSISSVTPCLEEQVKSAINLFTLFPNLDKLLTENISYQAYLKELEALVCSFRDTIITYLRH